MVCNSAPLVPFNMDMWAGYISGTSINADNITSLYSITNIYKALRKVCHKYCFISLRAVNANKVTP